MKPVYESDGSAIATHADGSSQKGRGERQANPQAWTDQEMERRKWHGHIHRPATLHNGGAFRAAGKAPANQRTEISRIEGNSLDDADSKRRQCSPEDRNPPG